MTITNIYLVRHGLSTYNQAGRMQGASDRSTLTAEGRKAALDTGQALANIRFDRVMTSPLARARETCELILARNTAGSAEPEYDYELRETNMYGWEGQTMVELRRNYPQQWHLWQNSPAEMSLDVEGKTIYPVRDLYARADRFIRQQLVDCHAENILLVSHGGINQALINMALGLDATCHQSFQQSNCCINYLTRDTRFRLVQLNNTVPMGEKLPKLKARKEGVRVIFAVRSPASTWSEPELVAHLGLTGPKIETAPQTPARLTSTLAPLSEDHTTLHNLIAMTSATELPDLLQNCFQTPAALATEVAFAADTLTIVHHAASHPRPIIQSINLGFRRQKSEARRQRIEDRRQKTEDRRQILGPRINPWF